METADLVIVGAGLHGLSMAKTYRELNPRSSVVVFDAATSIGGVWAKERIYPGLKTNNMVGTYEFSDFPFDLAQFGLRTGEHMSGMVVHDYLQAFVEKFDLTDLIRLDITVREAELRQDSTWLLRVTDSTSEAAKSTSLITRKLVLATGLTSVPVMPIIKGSENFRGSIFHAKELASRAPELRTAENVVVLGASKSAYDACYVFATTWTQVHWVIRASGHGPSWIAPRYVTPLKLWLERLILTRFLTWFDPCIWGDADGFSWVRWLLHSTWIGQLIVTAFWFVLGDDVVKLNGYDKHPETAKLKPRTPVFWTASALSILNYDQDIFELIRKGRIKVYLEDVDRLEEQGVRLSNKEKDIIPAEAVVCCTGWDWRPPLKFLPEGLEDELGLPSASKVNLHNDDLLLQKADREILERLPRLKDRPQNQVKNRPANSPSTLNPFSESTKPYTLYRFMLPPSPSLLKSRNIAFIGAHLSVSTVTVAQVQALWICAFFQDKIPGLHEPESEVSAESIRWDTVLHSRFGVWRHPPEAGGYGNKFPDMAFASLPYVDMLLKDLGLKHRRKGGWWWKEAFVPYTQRDYKRLVEEWKNQVASQENGEIGDGIPRTKKLV